jgi:hypothetical protein
MKKIFPLLIGVCGLVLLINVIGCSDDATGPKIILYLDNNLVFERTDGSRVDFAPDVSVKVMPWESDVPVETLHIRGRGPGMSYWSLRAVIKDVQSGERIDFPNNFIWNEPKGADLFVFDAPNELSSSEEESRGRIVFDRIDLDGSVEVQFSIDAVLGSEYHDGDSLKVYGDLSVKCL